MKTFILILTTFNYYGVAVEHVPGFATREACLAAANEWLQQSRKVVRSNVSDFRALCARSE